MATSTRHLKSGAFRGLQKLGDAMCPGDGEFPSFSRLGCAEHVDVILDEMPAADRDQLKTLLAVLSYVPIFGIAGLIALLEKTSELPGPLGVGVRFLRMGLRGLIMTLYYSGNRGASYEGPTPLDIVGYHVSVYTADMDPQGVGSDAHSS